MRALTIFSLILLGTGELNWERLEGGWACEAVKMFLSFYSLYLYAYPVRNFLISLHSNSDL